MRSLIRLMLCVFVVACGRDPTAPETTMEGDWIATGGTYFRTFLLTVREDPDGTLRGEAVAWRDGCASDCRMTGFVIAGHRDGEVVTLTVSFLQPVGIDMSGSLDAGRYTATVTRMNTSHPSGMRLAFRRP